MKVTFIDGVDTVTGSCHKLTIGSTTILVDCGIKQGNEFETPKAPQGEVDYCILTHAHLDHSGLIPLLVKEKKIRKNIISTTATKLLADILLRDLINIYRQEGKHPLYTEKDLENSFNKWITYDYGIEIPITNSIKATFYDSAHIIGSSSVFITYADKYNIFFSGDIGTKNTFLLRYPPKHPPKASYIVLESTYGNKNHENNIDETITFIKNVIKEGGKVVIPAFSVGRSQEVIYALNKYKVDCPIYLDSPMSNKVTSLSNAFSPYLLPLTDINKNLFNGYIPVENRTQSNKLAGKKEPCIIVSASGMASGGRVVNHINAIKEDEKSAIVFVGYQAKNTRGYRILSGDEKVKCKVFKASGFSAHADKNELIEYIKSFSSHPDAIFLTHGEDEQRHFLSRILNKRGYFVYLPKPSESYELQERYTDAVEETINSGGAITFKEFEGRISELYERGYISRRKLKDFAGYLSIGKETALSWCKSVYEKKRFVGVNRTPEDIQLEIYNLFKRASISLTVEEIEWVRISLENKNRD